MDQVHIVGTLPVSTEVLADAQWLDKAIVAALDTSPEARRRFEERQRTAHAERSEARLNCPPAVLDLDGLLDRLSWSRAYAAHLVQPYCSCGPDRDDGWYVCEHATDLGLP